MTENSQEKINDVVVNLSVEIPSISPFLPNTKSPTPPPPYDNQINFEDSELKDDPFNPEEPSFQDNQISDKSEQNDDPINTELKDDPFNFDESSFPDNQISDESEQKDDSINLDELDWLFEDPSPQQTQIPTKHPETQKCGKQYIWGWTKVTKRKKIPQYEKKNDWFEELEKQCQEKYKIQDAININKGQNQELALNIDVIPETAQITLPNDPEIPLSAFLSQLQNSFNVEEKEGISSDIAPPALLLPSENNIRPNDPWISYSPGSVTENELIPLTTTTIAPLAPSENNIRLNDDVHLKNGN